MPIIGPDRKDDQPFPQREGYRRWRDLLARRPGEHSAFPSLARHSHEAWKR
jgi:hypothetical protein